MMKMLIQLDEERIKADGECDSAKMWAAIDRTFARKECIKEVQPDGSVMYLGNPNRDNLLADFGYAYLSLIEWEPFAQYCSKWICYDNEFDEDSPFDEDDVLAKERIRTPLFAKYAR
ncbi:MAG: hypothetical protein SO434_02040 [Eubacteriales bacterium]|nr:hypothetical protein [Eubacteriales bacterium]